MVELGVPTYVFGKEPDKSKPPVAYPGVSPTAFDPASQLMIYKEMLRKERDGKLNSDVTQRKWYKKMGYETNPVTGRPLSPKTELSPSPEMFSALSGQRSGSRKGSTLGTDAGLLPPLRRSASELVRSDLSATRPLSTVLSAATHLDDDRGHSVVTPNPAPPSSRWTPEASSAPGTAEVDPALAGLLRQVRERKRAAASSASEPSLEASTGLSKSYSVPSVRAWRHGKRPQPVSPSRPKPPFCL